VSNRKLKGRTKRGQVILYPKKGGEIPPRANVNSVQVIRGEVGLTNHLKAWGGHGDRREVT